MTSTRNLRQYRVVYEQLGSGVLTDYVATARTVAQLRRAYLNRPSVLRLARVVPA